MGRAFEDFPIGTRLVSRTEKISEDEIIAFARRYDPQPFHLGTVAGESLIGGLAASGWQTAAVSMRLFIEIMEVEGGIIGRAIDELRWPLAVQPGDELRVEVEIMEARLSLSKPGYGLLRYRSLTKNQDDKVVQNFIALAILPTRKSSWCEQAMGSEGIEPPTNTV